MPTGRFRFTRNERLHLNKDFQKVFKEGRSVHSGALVLYTCFRRPEKHIFPGSRVGIIASRKTAGAVQRNKLKRRIREIFRLNNGKLQPFIDMIIIAKKEAPGLDYKELEKTILALWRKSNVMKKEETENNPPRTVRTQV